MIKFNITANYKDYQNTKGKEVANFHTVGIYKELCFI